MSEKLKSRKLWVTVAGTAIVTLLYQLGLDEAAKMVAGVVASYNVGQGVADSVKK